MKNHAIAARKRVFDALPEGALLLLDASQAPHRSIDVYHAFYVDHNFYYLTGINAPKARLLMLKTASSEKTMLFLEPDTPLSLKWDGPKFSKEDAIEVGGFAPDEVHSLTAFDGQFNQLMNFARSPYGNPPTEVWLDLYHERLNTKPRSLSIFGHIIENYPELKIANANAILSQLRMIKSPEEIAVLKEAIALTHKGLKRILKSIKNRSNEHELVADFMHEITLNGSSGKAFDIIAAAGKNATVLHYTANNGPLDGDMILFDLGAKSGRYGADISRVYPLNGKYEGFAKDVYMAVLDVEKAVIKAVKPGLTWKDLNVLARDLLAEKAIALGMIESKDELSNVYYHSVGHYLGLDVHDVGVYTEPFKPGMVLTIEPGLYGNGVGVRIEDNVLVTEDGCENLSAAIEKEPEAIEKML